jgi:hypothetical protein
MFDFPGTAQAIIFMSTLTGIAIAGPLFLAYASHALLVVVTESTVGDPEVRWPEETVADWWWQPIYCVGMLTFWLTGGLVIVGPLALVSPWAFGIVGALFIWYAYPLGMLCVMDAQNSLAVVHLPLILRILRHPMALLVVGVATMPLGAAVVGLLSLTILHSTIWVIPLAFVMPIAVLLYARSWGRLAWMVLNVKRQTPRADDEKPPPEAAHASVLDPWALPAREEPPEMEVEVEEPPPEPDGDDEWAANPRAYNVPVHNAAGAEPAPFSHEQYYAGYRKREEARKARAEGRTPGEKKRRRRATLRNAFGPDFWAFLGDHRTLRVGVGIGLLTLVLLTLVRVAILMLPGA